MIQRIFKSLLEFMMGNRQTGHTSLLNDLAKKNDIYIIVTNEDTKNVFDPEVHDKLVPLHNIHKLVGAENKPILIDNAALQLMLREILLEIGTVEQKMEMMDQHVEQIEHILLWYRKAFPKKNVNIENVMAQSAIRMSGDYLNQNRE